MNTNKRTLDLVRNWANRLPVNTIVNIADVAPNKPTEFKAIVQVLINEGLPLQFNDDGTKLRKYDPRMKNFVEKRDLLNELIRVFDIDTKSIKVYINNPNAGTEI